MVDPYVANITDQSGFGSSNHEHRSTQVQRHSTSYRLSKASNVANTSFNGSNHGSLNANGLNGSSNHSRNAFRNKSLTKPRIANNNSAYDPLGGNSNHSSRSTGSFLHSYKKPDLPQKSQYLAMDCEMVGTITGESVAARVVLIDWRGRTVLDIYVKPDVEIADYRTFVSGITKEHLENAPSFSDAQKQIKDLLQDKILVGHGVDNDLRSLGMVHPWLTTRDTAYYQPFMRQLETSTNQNTALRQEGANNPIWGPRKLKELAKEKLQRDIQVVGASHCPVEDALAALDLYKSHRPRWEACMSSEERQQKQYALQMAAARAAYEYESSILSSTYNNSLVLPRYTSTLTPPNHFHISSPNISMNSSMHSYSRYSETNDENRLDGNMHGHSTQTMRTLSNDFLNLGLQDTYQKNKSLDCRSYHAPFANRPQFHRSSSLTESPISYTLHSENQNVQNKSFQRQSSLEYAPHGLQRQSSLQIAPPGRPNQSKFAFARDNREVSAPPGFNQYSAINT
jgi:RNA exonuclease 4